MLPAETIITLTSSDAPVTVDGVQYGNQNQDEKVDVGETAELNGDAVGFAITNADLALALLRTGTQVYRADSDSGSNRFVGTSVFQLGASSVVVDLNLASGSGITESTPVVNFDKSFNEQRRLFDTDHDGTITVGELRALNGQRFHECVCRSLHLLLTRAPMSSAWRPSFRRWIQTMTGDCKVSEGPDIPRNRQPRGNRRQE